MSESEPLVKHNPFKNFIENTNIHKISQEILLSQLNTTLDGLNSEEAKAKRKNVGLNYINQPLNAPAWLCCLLPCLMSTDSMRKYNECVPDFGYVKRNKKWLKLDCISIVPGDIVRIAKGERVPADIRILKSSACIFDGSSIMGKSEFIAADPDKCSESYLDSPNLAFLGYLCVSGECTGVVIATGNLCLMSKMISQRVWPPSEF